MAGDGGVARLNISAGDLPNVLWFDNLALKGNLRIKSSRRLSGEARAVGCNAVDHPSLVH